jgi:hypothetical protein
MNLAIRHIKVVVIFGLFTESLTSVISFANSCKLHPYSFANTQTKICFVWPRCIERKPGQTVTKLSSENCQTEVTMYQ